MKRTAVRRSAPWRSPHDRNSFSLYPRDRQILSDLQAEFATRGLKTDRTKLVRCLLHTTSELDLFACAVVQHREDALRKGPRESENVAERFTIEQLGSDREKLTRVLRRLEASNIRMNDSYVLRSLLRRLPPIDALIALFQSYLEEFPDGRSSAAREKKRHD